MNPRVEKVLQIVRRRRLRRRRFMIVATACTAIALLAILLACTTLVEPDAQRQDYQLANLQITSRVPHYAWVTTDTSANTILLQLSGSRVAGAARVQGEWWVDLRYDGILVERFSVLFGPYGGTYGVFGDTLRLQVRGENGDSWLNLVNFHADTALLKGTYADAAIDLLMTLRRR